MPNRDASLDSEEDPYLVTSPLEIAALLRTVSRRKVLIRLHVPQRDLSIITTLLHLDAEQGRMIMDNSATIDQDRRILDAPSVHFDSNLDSIRITFNTGGLEPCEYEGLPALSLPVPQSLRRIQRRNTHRIDIPVSQPLHCRIGPPKSAIVLPVRDISAGGLLLREEGQFEALEVGHVFTQCLIDLPGSGEVTTSLRVARISEPDTPHSLQRVRMLGCSFFELSSPMSIRVQHYIVTLERRLIARARGFD